jgi:hypothetical protein
MSWLFRSLALATLVLLAGCATGGNTPSASAIAPGQATISISRADEFMYSGGSVSVELNGAKVASIGKGESYTGGVDPGPAVVSVSAWASPGASHHRFNAERGKTYRFVVSAREANFAAGMIGGVLGQAIEGGGPFEIKQVN